MTNPYNKDQWAVKNFAKTFASTCFALIFAAPISSSLSARALAKTDKFNGMPTVATAMAGNGRPSNP